MKRSTGPAIKMTLALWASSTSRSASVALERQGLFHQHVLAGSLRRLSGFKVLIGGKANIDCVYFRILKDRSKVMVFVDATKKSRFPGLCVQVSTDAGKIAREFDGIAAHNGCQSCAGDMLQGPGMGKLPMKPSPTIATFMAGGVRESASRRRPRALPGST